MTRLVVQADDIAITHATTLGILDAISVGIVRTTGLFTNRPDAAFAAARLREIDGIDVGLDVNFVTGRPLLPAVDVPGLVDERGRFWSSGHIKATHRVVGGSGPYLEFDIDPFDPDQARAEAGAQFRRFIELMGRPPAYLHHHSLVSPASDMAVRELATAHGVPFVDDLYRSGTLPLLDNDWYTAPFSLEDQASADALGAMKRLLPEITANDVSLLITHPGYVDAELLEVSSYSIVRARDQQLVTCPKVRTMLDAAGVELITLSQALPDAA